MNDDDFEPEDGTTQASSNPFRNVSPNVSPKNTSSSLPSNKRKKTGGKKKGWRKAATKMENGRYTEEDLYKYVPKDCIPSDQIDRFVSLCDAMIKDLGVDTMSDSDLEEVTLYYRERIYCDLVYRTFAEAGGTTDSALIMHIEKLNKALEQRKSNLGSRFVDKGKKRKDNNTSTLMELLSRFNDDTVTFNKISIDKTKEIEDGKKNFTSTHEYMSTHAGSKRQDPLDD